MLRGAIIGFGNIAMRGHVPAYTSDEVLRSKLKIVAVMDVADQNRDTVQEMLPGTAYYSNIQSLLQQERLDFVDICTPPSTHAEYIRASAEKKVHIICEKPLTDRFTSASNIMKTVTDANIVFMPCHQYKYSPLWKTIHDIIHSGELGEVTLAQFNVVRLQADTGSTAWNPQWRTNKNHSGGGILVDTGAHYFYLIQYFFGMPKKISAVLRSLKHRQYGVEDTAVVTLDYSARLIQLSLTWAGSQRANSVLIVGTKGSLSYDGTRLLQRDDKSTREIPMPDVTDKQQYIDWYASLFKEFTRRVEGKIYSDDVLCEAFNVMHMLDLSYRSSEEQRVLEV